jgi:hypothetical protein
MGDSPVVLSLVALDTVSGHYLLSPFVWETLIYTLKGRVLSGVLFHCSRASLGSCVAVLTCLCMLTMVASQIKEV